MSVTENFSISQQVKIVHSGSQFLGFANVIKCFLITDTREKRLKAIAFVICQCMGIIDGVNKDKKAPCFIVST